MPGEFLIILAQLCYAIGALLVKQISADISPILVIFVVDSIGVITLTPILFRFGNELKYFSGQNWIFAILAGLFWIVLGEMLYVSGLAKTQLANASFVGLSFPLFATTLGILFLHETLNTKFILAAILIIIAYFLLVS